jgi:hypothetical protein
MPQIPPIDANIVVIAAIAVGGVYGLVAGKQRLRLFILSLYVGIVLSEQLTDSVAPQLKMLSHEQVSWLLLGVPVLIFGLVGIGFHKSHERGHALVNLIVGLLTGALIASAALHVLPVSQLTDIDRSSPVAKFIQQYYLVLLGVLPIVALFMGFLRKPEKKKH